MLISQSRLLDKIFRAMFAPIGVALIGSGIFAREEHLVSAVPPDRCYIVSLLLMRSSLPISAQPAFIREALQAGKHVLSEKPIAKDVNTAHELLSFYRSSIAVDRISWSVGENYRLVETHVFAASEVQRLGRILGFRGRFNRDIKPGGKYYETAWRKVPEYQGGFLLDAGVHFTAVLRLLLGPQDGKLKKLSAFTCQLQKHLPPVDTANATLKCKSGASGVFEMSVGSTFKGGGFSIACEDGTVTILGDSVVTADKNGHESVKHFKSEGWGGVNHEVKCWAEGMQTGKWNPRMKPEEALADLEIVGVPDVRNFGR
ncbi:MAG: hypothetical protein Q9162_000828 [Coniocarpon cinnabarinum]